MIASHGQMLVATFQVGRVYGGSCDIRWSTSLASRATPTPSIVSVGNTACNGGAGATITPPLRSSQGPMVGDYATADVIATGSSHGREIESFAVGLAPEPDDNALSERMYAPACGLGIGIGTTLPPATKPPGNRAPVPPANPHRTAH